MLALITLMIMAALAIGGANFRTVTNMQFRDEAIAAANKAIDQVVGSPFALDPAGAAETIKVDLDNNGTTDYEVDIAVPQCIRATLAETTRRAACRCRRRWGPCRRGTRSGRSGPRLRRAGQRRRSCSGRAHGRARAAEPGAEGRGVHMKRNSKLDQHDQTPPGDGPGSGLRRPAWRCSSRPPRRRTSTCSFSRLLPRGTPNVLIILDNTANWNTPFTNEMAALVETMQRPAGQRRRHGEVPGRPDAVHGDRQSQQQHRRRVRPGRGAGSRRRPTSRCTWTLVNSLHILNDKSNGGKAGLTMMEAYYYFDGQNPAPETTRSRRTTTATRAARRLRRRSTRCPDNALEERDGSRDVAVQQPGRRRQLRPELHHLHQQRRGAGQQLRHHDGPRLGCGRRRRHHDHPGLAQRIAGATWPTNGRGSWKRAPTESPPTRWTSTR